MSKDLLLPIAKNLPISTVDGFNNLINSWKDYKVTCQVEQTKRSQIAADRDVRLAAIKAQAHAVQALIENTFAERAKNFDSFFELLDEGFINGNAKQIDAALGLIVQQIKISPMAQAVELMNQINDPDIDVIEI